MDDARIGLAQKLLTQLAQGAYTEAVQQFDTTMQGVLPPETLQATWQKLEEQMGGFQNQEAPRTTQVQDHQVVLINCVFARGNLEFMVVFNEANEISGLSFNPLANQAPAEANADLPAYIQPEAFREIEVLVGQGEWSLPGTLTLPLGEGPFPALVLVQGSGPQDRDETLGPNKPLRDLAWGLASRGIAVLRYDKRTLVYKEKVSQQFLETITVQEETIDDTLAALRLLRESPQIDSQRLFVLGHSLGGYLLPRITAADREIAGLIVLAGSTRPLEDIILDQVTYLLAAQEHVAPEQQKSLETLTQQVRRVKAPDLTPDTPASELPLNVPAAYWLDLRTYDPVALARTLPQPMLILQAECDYQVTMEDFRGWQDGLGTRTDVAFKSYPGLYHLFLPTPDGKMATPVVYALSGHVQSDVIDDIAQWIMDITAHADA